MTYTTAEAHGELRRLEDAVLNCHAMIDVAADAMTEIRRLRRETNLVRFPEPDMACRPSNPHLIDYYRDGLD
jgi:hypothetical protein